MRTSPQIEHHDICVELTQPAQEPHAAQMTRLCISQVAMCGTDQLKVRDRSIDDELGQIFDALGNEIREASLWRRHTEARVEIRTFKIHVDDDYTFTESCEGRC